MIEAEIVPVSMDELPVIVDLFNVIFRPTRTIDNFQRRLAGKIEPLLLLAKGKGQNLGFFVGYEWKPTTFYGWFYGVLPDFRRQGITSQLMDYAHNWATQKKYRTFRIECLNSQRPMLHLGIELGYDIVGIRFDTDRKDNLILLEKTLV